MSGEYFDEDDLINDYIEEDFDSPPPEYDEAFAEEIEQQHVTGTGDDTCAKKQDSATEAEPMDATTDTINDLEPPISTIHTQGAATEAQNSPQKTDLYKFERYQGTHAWRKKPETTEDIMVAENWKRRNGSPLGKSLDITATKKPGSTPEVQLVEFLNRSTSSKVVIRKSVAKRLGPKEGVESVPMTLADGTRLHIPRNEPISSKEDLLGAGARQGHMLGVSISELFRWSDAISRKAERRNQLHEQSNPSNADNDDDDAEPMESETPKPETSDHHLWVDKHAPTVFSHLLSDERTNREVLRALRAWDPYVFRRDPPPRPAVVQQHQQQQQQKKDSHNGETSSNPHDVRPDVSNRVLLLSGPPGVGKTTLAHIVARHAGYRPLEINSSDGRSASVLKERVVRGMESSALSITTNNTKNDLIGRPNCLVFDEIDGADARGAVAAIVDIIKAHMPTSKKGKQSTYLRRPIIFICNHKYAPALRPLLPYARQFDVGPPSPTRLVQRLRSVLSEENLSLVGGGALLHQLVAGTGGDIRSCLYTLQFASARAREVGKRKHGAVVGRDAPLVVDVSQALRTALGDGGNGMKDARNDIAGTVTTVFRKVKNQQLPDDTWTTKAPSGVDRVLQSVQNFGDNSKTLDCLFANVLRVSFVDPTLDKCFAAHEWLSSADIYRSRRTSVASNNHMEHNAMQRLYIPSAAAAVHLLCRVETKADLVFSTRQLTDLRCQLESNAGLVNKFAEGLAPKSRVGAVGNNVVTETIPYALWMLSAGEGSCSLNRAVSSLEVLSDHERLAFEAHVATLRALGLTYVAEEQDGLEATTQAMANMRLEPQIDRIVRFEQMSSGNRRQEIPSTLKELLAHGASLERMREREAVVEDTKQQERASGEKDFTATTSPVETRKNERAIESNTLEHLSTSPKHKIHEEKAIDPPAKRPKVGSNFLGIGAAKAKAAKTARKAMQVGFDRSKKIKLSNTGSGVEYNKVVRFKFSRGFTQAVRKPCRLEDLL